MVDRTQSEAPGALMIETEQRDDTYVVRISGELDLASCAAFDRELRRAEASEAGQILVDLDGLVFIDSAGLMTIRQAHRRAELDPGRLRITSGTGHVADLFRLTAFDQSPPFAADGSAS
ncbi:MAG: STAS domain-containing protein [Solirubrobacterales bacterium]